MDMQALLEKARLYATTALSPPLDPEEKAALVDWIYEHQLYEKWLDPEDASSERDRERLQTLSARARDDGFQAEQAERFRFFTMILEALNVHPEHRDWSRRILEQEGITWDETVPASKTKRARTETLHFYTKDRDEYDAKRIDVSAGDINKDTIVVLGGATANNRRQISKHLRVLQSDVLKPMGLEERKILYLSENLNYFTESSAETHEYNQDPEHYTSPRATALARMIFGPKISRDGIQVDDEGRVRGERLPLDEVKRNLRTNFIGISRGCALFMCMMNEVERCMGQLGYNEKEISEATREVFGNLIGPSTRFVPRKSGATINAVLSENDLLVRSRVDTEPLFSHLEVGQKTARVDIDDRQSVFLSRIPKVVMVDRPSLTGNGMVTEPYLKDSNGITRYDKYGHSYNTYVRDNFLEFDRAPGYAIGNVVGAEQVPESHLLFAPVFGATPGEKASPQYSTFRLFIPSDVAVPSTPVNTAVDDVAAAQWVQRTLSEGDTIRSEVRRMAQEGEGTSFPEKPHRRAVEYLDILDREADGFNFASILRTRARDPRTRDRTFVSVVNEQHPGGIEQYTYAEADRKVNQIRRMLAYHGFDGNAKVALRCICPEHLFTRNAVLAGGGVVAPLSVAYEDKDLLPRLELVGADAIVITPDFLEQTVRVREKLKKPMKIFVVERDGNGEKIQFSDRHKLLGEIAKHEGVYPFFESAQQYSDSDLSISKVGRGQTAFSMMTSGSSGVMKQVLVPHSYALASFIRSNGWWGVNGAATAPEHNTNLQGLPARITDTPAAESRLRDGVDVIYCTAPFGWMYPNRGELIAEITGAEYIIPQIPGYRQKPEFTVDVLDKKKVTVLASIPSNFRGLNASLEARPTKLPNLRHAISTGEPLDAETMGKFRKLTGTWICNGWAMTEEGPIAAFHEGSTPVPNAIGPLVPGVECKLEEIKQEADPASGKMDSEPAEAVKAKKFYVKLSPVSGTYEYAADVPPEKADQGLCRDVSTAAVYRDTKDAVQFSETHPTIIQGVHRTDELFKRKAIQIFAHDITDPLKLSFSGEGEFKDIYSPVPFSICHATGIPDKEKTNIMVAYIELPPEEVKALGGDDLLYRVRAATETMTRLKVPDFVIIGQTDTERKENKYPKKKVSEALGRLVEMFRSQQEVGGVFVLPPSEKLIERMDSGELIDAFDKMRVLRSRSGKMTESHKEEKDIQFSSDAIKSIQIPEDPGSPVTVQYYESVCKAKLASTAVTVVKEAGEYYFLLTQRGEGIQNPKGVVFPGGGVESHKSYGTVKREETLSAAIRETMEEISLGIDKDQMYKLPASATVTGYAVQPYLALLADIDFPEIERKVNERAAQLKAESKPVEVERVFMVPVKDFFDRRKWGDDKVIPIEAGNADRGVPTQKYRTFNYEVTVPGKGGEPDEKRRLGSLVVETIFHLVSYHQNYEKFAKEMDFLLGHRGREFTWKDSGSFPDDMSKKQNIEQARRDFLLGYEFPDRTNYEQQATIAQIKAATKAAPEQREEEPIMRRLLNEEVVLDAKVSESIARVLEGTVNAVSPHHKDMRELTNYEARAVLAFAQQEDRFLKIEGIQRAPNGKYNISMVLSQGAVGDALDAELGRVRSQGRSDLDAGDVSDGKFGRTKLPDVSTYADVEVLSTRPGHKRG